VKDTIQNETESSGTTRQGARTRAIPGRSSSAHAARGHTRAL
jgi:hypothetical protein